jgi:hypothetical protein
VRELADKKIKGTNRKDLKTMGMSASQARFLCLTARKNNVEFEGQQINQQRTTLSNESGSYYSELCNMTVPTPPSIDDYTKVSYTFDDGALTNTITSMIAKDNNKYSISYIQQWQDDYSIVSASSSIISKTDDGYKIGSSILRILGDTTGYNISKDSYLSGLDEDQLADLLEEEEYFQTMLNETVLGNVSASDNWYVRYVKDSSTGSYKPYFYQASDVENDSKYTDDGYATSNINCYSLGSSTKTKEVLNATGSVEKDSTGRYISIILYQTDDDGNIKKNDDGSEIYTEYSLTTNTATDEDAYNDAMNQYNYEQYQYDQKVQEINSKIEIIQQQDKSLELELKQLDTEESAISTEIDAVKKVISKNVENSFKTFNA